MCAGKGSRLGYKAKPKCMALVNKKPVLEHLVNHLNKHGVTEIIVNISAHSDYTKIFKYFGTRLLYFYEPTLLGEAGTERMLREWLGNEYIVMNGDTLTNINITKLVNYSILSTTRFTKNGKYAGTMVVRRNMPSCNGISDWEGQDAYYFDIGTPAKLAKARKFFK